MKSVLASLLLLSSLSAQALTMKCGDATTVTLDLSTLRMKIVQLIGERGATSEQEGYAYHKSRTSPDSKSGYYQLGNASLLVTTEGRNIDFSYAASDTAVSERCIAISN